MWNDGQKSITCNAHYTFLRPMLSSKDVYWFQTERDVSVRQRAVDLLYAMCDRTNAEEIVGEMLEYLESADYSIREEMVTGLQRQYYIFI